MYLNDEMWGWPDEQQLHGFSCVFFFLKNTCNSATIRIIIILTESRIHAQYFCCKLIQQLCLIPKGSSNIATEATEKRCFMTPHHGLTPMQRTA